MIIWTNYYYKYNPHHVGSLVFENNNKYMNSKIIISFALEFREKREEKKIPMCRDFSANLKSDIQLIFLVPTEKDCGT